MMAAVAVAVAVTLNVGLVAADPACTHQQGSRARTPDLGPRHIDHPWSYALAPGHAP
jgi:hypothetical protein